MHRGCCPLNRLPSHTAADPACLVVRQSREDIKRSDDRVSRTKPRKSSSGSPVEFSPHHAAASWPRERAAHANFAAQSSYKAALVHILLLLGTPKFHKHATRCTICSYTDICRDTHHLPRHETGATLARISLTASSPLTVNRAGALEMEFINQGRCKNKQVIAFFDKVHQSAVLLCLLLGHTGFRCVLLVRWLCGLRRAGGPSRKEGSAAQSAGMVTLRLLER